MTAELIVGAILGGLIGASVTQVERQVGPRGHTIIGSIAGATIGILVIAYLSEVNS